MSIQSITASKNEQRCGVTDQRPLPPGLTPKEAKILTKVKKRAHCLDTGFKLCGVQCGWTFFLALIPFLGEIVNALLSYHLVIKKCKQIDECVTADSIPQSLIDRMVFNMTVSSGLGLVPIIGDFALAAWKANFRNAALLEKCGYLLTVLSDRAKKKQGTSNYAAPPVPTRPAEASARYY